MVEKLPRTTDVIQKGIAQGLHPGAQLYIWHRGQTILDDGIGEARPGIAMQSNTINHWRSSGKPVTAVAIAQLWERGMLALDDRVARHIPEFGINGKEPITLRQILTHTAGFRGFGLIWDRPIEEVLERIYAMPLESNWKIGQTAGYHAASSWFILGEIIRRIDGRPIERYVREQIFLPLGMTDSWIGMEGQAYRDYAARDRIAVMYDTERGMADLSQSIADEHACAASIPGANYRAPARELGRFYETLLTNAERRSPRTILMPQTIEAMIARHRTGIFDLSFQHKIDFGLGFILNSNLYGPETVPYNYGPHASPRTFGHSGAQSSCAFCDPENQLVAAWVCNGAPGERRHQQRQRQINAAIYEDVGIAR